ncbi:fungal-specific transcription factor domain-containing protein [Lyophyllum atratum]|nr:fungal-specific transcription factor domain-containing protein [Lyophyllum atratum]
MEHPSHPAVYKRRRLQGACDICKQKKSDSAVMPHNRCSNCIAFSSDCTHSSARKRTAPSNELSDSHMPSMSNKPFSEPLLKGPLRLAPQLGKLQEDLQSIIHPLVQPLLPPSSSIDFHTQLPFLSSSSTPVKSSLSGRSSSPEMSEDAQPDHSGATSTSSDEIDLYAQLKRLTITSSHTRHFGPSSTMSLLGTAIQIGGGAGNTAMPEDHFGYRRPQFWNVHPWESLSEEELTPYEFPDPELLHALVGIYFDQVNAHFPLLHQPTYEKAVKEELYLSNHHFGATVLGVCAVASRYSDDPRVLSEGFASRHSSGWKWFRQIRQCWRSSSRTPSLYELQTICLSVLYTQGTSQPEACWVIIGIGIRHAQDVGAHRKKLNQKPSVENELWKRCFWVLMCVDAIVCSFLGRPRATISDDFDLDLPLECDDEYWETADLASTFLQPEGKPSKVSAFIAYVKLIEILEYAQRTLHAANQPKRFRGPARGQSDENVVAHLDSELNQWFEHIPHHLKWISVSPGNVFHEQSALLHACYHHVRILVHRSFIPSPKKPSPLPFPSLAICTNAARSCAHILKSQSQQGTYLPFPPFAIFTSAIVLLLNYWTNLKSSNLPRGISEDVKNVQDCISLFSRLEKRWTTAGRFADIIRELAAYGDVPLTAPSAEASQKRKNDDAPLDTPSPADYTPQFPQGQEGDPHYTPDQDDASQAPQEDTWSYDSHSWVGGDQNMSDGAVLDGTIGLNDWWGNENEHAQNVVQSSGELGMPLYADPSVSYMPQSESFKPKIRD